ncbi:immunity 22 family protein, partial [Priestia megaterium]|uniref:immunity 22 family protein n=2 Tax=Bacillaceae TaxID=186817 RepID=UPI0030008F04
MEKQGIVSIWLGNIKNQKQLEKYVDLTYDEEGESVPSKFFEDFNIDMDETDEDFIEKAVLEEKSDEISVLLEGCSYEEVII